MPEMNGIDAVRIIREKLGANCPTILALTAEDLTGEPPNVDFTLAALADAYDLPKQAPFVIFALSRSVGWIAHALEQIAAGQLIRPRARYVGPALAKEHT